MADPTVLAAVITSVPATAAALVSWRAVRNVHDEVRTNHGKRAGAYVEETALGVEQLKTAFATHVVQDAVNFDELRRGQDALKDGQESLHDRLDP